MYTIFQLVSPIIFSILLPLPFGLLSVFLILSGPKASLVNMRVAFVLHAMTAFPLFVSAAHETPAYTVLRSDTASFVTVNRGEVPWLLQRPVGLYLKS